MKSELHRDVRAQKTQAKIGIPASDVAEATLRALKEDRYEVAIGLDRVSRFASRIAPRFFHKMLNKQVTK
ncbi:MAG: hypothetical protein HC880_19000 [Bacteroidia bacterium]|nr:hypothetical protein [Bacteroidia bacterium]